MRFASLSRTLDQWIILRNNTVTRHRGDKSSAQLELASENNSLRTHFHEPIKVEKIRYSERVPLNQNTTNTFAEDCLKAGQSATDAFEDDPLQHYIKDTPVCRHLFRL